MIPNFNSAREFTQYLVDVLIPDLRESGSDATADDFTEAVYWIAKLRLELES